MNTVALFSLAIVLPRFVVVQRSFASSRNPSPSRLDRTAVPTERHAPPAQRPAVAHRARARSDDEIEKPQLTFGIVADIQYAPIPNGFSYAGVPRYYPNAVVAARRAAEDFEASGMELVCNLGDIVDGKCQMIEEEGGTPLPPGMDPGEKAVDDVLEALAPYKNGPILHTYGNHELYNLNREELGRKLGIPFHHEGDNDDSETVGYYRSRCYNGVRFVVLDTYDINTLGRPSSSRKRQQAEAILERENPNFSKGSENSPIGLKGLQRRFVAFNGGIDKPQLRWIEKTLQEARRNGERCILLSHQPILPGSASPMCIVWNHEELMEVLREYGDVILCAFAGHAHKGGYRRDEASGIHFRTVEAVLENMEPTYGKVEVYEDRLVICGFGNCASAEYDLSHTTAAVEDSRLDSRL